MTSPQAFGQLYLLEVRCRYKGDKSYEKIGFVVVGESADDVKSKIRWHLDLSEFDEFAIKKLRRIKPFHRLWSRIETPAEYTARKSKPRGAVSDSSTTFAVGISGNLIARTRDHALKKLGHFLLNKASGQSADNPLGNDGQVIIEEQGDVDDTNTNSADRLGAINLEGKPMPGGLPTLGKSGR